MIAYKIYKRVKAKREKTNGSAGAPPPTPATSRRGAFRALTLNVVRASFRNRTAMFFTLGLAVLFMVIFGLLFSGKNASVTIGFVDRDQTPTSSQFIAELGAKSGITVEKGDLVREKDRLAHQNVDLVVVIPAGLQSALQHGAPVALQPLTSTANQQIGSLGTEIVGQGLARFVAAATHAAAPPVTVAQPQQETANKVAGVDYFLPAMLAYIVLQSGINFVAIGIVDLRARKVLRRLRATPVTPGQILGAHILGGMLTVFLQLLILTALGLSVFQAHTYGSWLVVLVPIVLGTAAFVGIGFMLTSAARTSESARGLSSMVAFPMMFLSGVFFPITQLPSWLQTLVHILPLTWLTDALHQVMNDGAGISAIAVDCLVLAAWAVVTIALATWRFRWD